MFNPSDPTWDDQLGFSAGLPDGEHVVFISDAKAETSNSGTPCVVLEFYCHDPASKSFQKSLKHQRYWTTDKALPRFVQLCRVAGVTKAFNLQDSASVADAMLDRLLRVTVKTKTDTYNGETRQKSEVRFVKPLNTADRERLIGQYGETMLPAYADGDAGTVQPQAQPVSNPVDTGFSDDEIPF